MSLYQPIFLKHFSITKYCIVPSKSLRKLQKTIVNSETTGDDMNLLAGILHVVQNAGLRQLSRKRLFTSNLIMNISKPDIMTLNQDCQLLFVAVARAAPANNVDHSFCLQYDAHNNLTICVKSYNVSIVNGIQGFGFW